MINYRFLNYKKYSTFEQDLPQISDDSIVFIQDKSCIWARGHLYRCKGTENDFTDTLLGWLTDLYANIDHYVLDNELKRVAYTGSYNDLRDTPTPLTIDTQLSETSANPVQNKAIYTALKNKANSSDLQGLAHISDLEQALATKQGVLTAGYGIKIQNDTISSTLDTEVYVIVSTLPPVASASPNKIYIVETNNGDGTYRYTQYRLRDGQFVSFDQLLPEINLKDYIKTIDADNRYQKRGNYITSQDLSVYATITALQDIDNKFNDYITLQYANATYQPKGDYATVSMLEDYVKRIEVYTPRQGESSSDGTSDTGDIDNPGTTVIQPVNIVVDSELSLISSNPVQNRTITIALNNKVNRSELPLLATKDELSNKLDAYIIDSYARKSELNKALDRKQDVLTAGRGIDIIDNVISTNLDTNLFVVVSQLPGINIDENKIYILEQFDDTEQEYVYYAYRWIGNDWRLLGRKDVQVDLTDYVTYTTGDRRYQPIGPYLTDAEIAELYQPLGNYALAGDITALENRIANTYQIAGQYALNEDLATAVDEINNIKNSLKNYATVEFTNSTYVKKKDVYTPKDDFSSESDSGDDNTNPGTDNPVQPVVECNCPKLVTLTVQQYQTLVDNNEVSANTYYFTYEEENATWGFGDQFPITFTNQWAFGGTFPITLS